MKGRQFSFGASGNPLAQILSLIVLGVVLVGAVIMGAFVLMAVIGFAFIGFLAFALRMWWLRRKLRRGAYGGGDDPMGSVKSVRYIEGEYKVIDEGADAERRRRSDERR